MAKSKSQLGSAPNVFGSENTLTKAQRQTKRNALRRRMYELLEQGRLFKPYFCPGCGGDSNLYPVNMRMGVNGDVLIDGWLCYSCYQKFIRTRRD